MKWLNHIILTAFLTQIQLFSMLRLVLQHHHPRYIARNVVLYCLLVKANNAKFSCQLLLLFCGRFETSGVQASCRAPNLIYQTHWPSHGCSGACGVCSPRWRCVSVVIQRKAWTSLSKKSSKKTFLNQARWPRRPLLVIGTVVTTKFFKIEDPCPNSDMS